MSRQFAFASVFVLFAFACGRSDVDFSEDFPFPSAGGAVASGGGTTRGGSSSVSAGGTGQSVGGSSFARGGTSTTGGSGGSPSFGGSISSGGSDGTAGFTSGGSGGAGGNTATGGSAGAPSSLCGNGVRQGREQCDLADHNEERPALELRQGLMVVPVVPVRTDSAVHVFYAYRDKSSHTGFEATERSRILLHLHAATGSLSLVMHHGQDVDVPGRQLRFAVQFVFSGLPTQSVIAVSDDASEFRKTSASSALGDFRFMLGESDGGALGALPFPANWVIKVIPNFDPQVQPRVEGHITHWDLANGDNSFTGLSLNEAVELRAYASPARCRTDCTIPACGDGILDGGEVCDDGNLRSNDGCSSDCKSLR